MLDAIKAELNRRTVAGRFVLTGSTRHDSLPAAAQALTGRLHILTLLPLSQGEIDGTPERFVPSIIADPSSVVTSAASTSTRSDYIERVCAGGFPQAIRRTGASRSRWFDDYVELSPSRDVAQLAPRLRQSAFLPRLLERFAAQTGQLLNVSAAAAATGWIAAPPKATRSCSNRCFSSGGYQRGERRSVLASDHFRNCTSSTPGWQPACCA